MSWICQAEDQEPAVSTIVRKPANTRKSWVVRYQANGKQRERGFATRALARDFQVKTDHDLREQTYADPRDGRGLFGEAAEAYLARLAIVDRTRATYREVWSRHLAPALAHRTLSQVAADRDGVARLLTAGQLGALSISPRRAARMIITGILDEAVKAGKIARHRCAGIELADNRPRNGHDAFIFPSHGQVAQVAGAAGIAVWLMRGCGLRISEALAVELADFRDGFAVLRVSGQASRDGRAKLPLKHRRAGEYRDVPVPGWLRDLVADLPDGPLCPGRDRPYKPYRTALAGFTRAAEAAGIPAGFTPHSLRHAFASALLARLVPITDLAVWLGHRNINVTYAIYGHLIPSASARAVAALDAEFAAWSGAA
jgi:integrase